MLPEQTAAAAQLATAASRPPPTELTTEPQIHASLTRTEHGSGSVFHNQNRWKCQIFTYIYLWINLEQRNVKLRLNDRDWSAVTGASLWLVDGCVNNVGFKPAAQVR